MCVCVFQIIGGLILALALMAQVLTNVRGGTDVHMRSSGLILLYAVGVVTMVIAILGAYGAHKESKPAMIVFLVCMVIGSLLMLRVAVTATIVRPRVEGTMEEAFRQFLPLDTAKEEVKETANAIQAQLHCCGLFSYEDWEGNIPDSCVCDATEEMEGMCQAVSYPTMFQKKSIYTKSCFPVLLQLVLMVVDIMLGVAFTLAALALLGMTLSSIIIHQMRYPNRAATLSVPAIFVPAPPKYQELHNAPAY